MNLSNPKVSIIVPVYNVQEYIKQCVDSLLQQSYQNLQIILVDDGSTDESGKICDRYKEKDGRIQVVHKKNGGSSSAREAGMNVVDGDYVMFVDGDDWLDLNAIEVCVAAIDNDQEIGCVLFSYTKETESVSTTMHIMDGNKVFIGSEVRQSIHRRLFGLSDSELKHPERMENIVSCCMKLYCVDLAKQGEYFDTKEVGSCEDGLFNIFALEKCSKAVYIDLPFYHYRKRQGSLVKSYKPDFIDQWGRLFSIMQDYIDKNGLDQTYQKALNNRIALSITAIALNELSNPQKKHLAVIRGYLHSEHYRTAVSTMNLSKLPFKWNCLLFCCKMGWTLPTYFGIRIISKILQRGKI